MNPIVNVRIPVALHKTADEYLVKDGFVNMQDLVKALLREYVQKKKELLLLEKLYASQKGKKMSKTELDTLARKYFS